MSRRGLRFAWSLKVLQRLGTRYSGSALQLNTCMVGALMVGAQCCDIMARLR